MSVMTVIESVATMGIAENMATVINGIVNAVTVNAGTVTAEIGIANTGPITIAILRPKRRKSPPIKLSREKKRISPYSI